MTNKSPFNHDFPPIQKWIDFHTDWIKHPKKEVYYHKDNDNIWVKKSGKNYRLMQGRCIQENKITKAVHSDLPQILRKGNDLQNSVKANNKGEPGYARLYFDEMRHHIPVLCEYTITYGIEWDKYNDPVNVSDCAKKRLHKQIKKLHGNLVVKEHSGLFIRDGKLYESKARTLIIRTDNRVLIEELVNTILICYKQENASLTVKKL